MLSEINVKTMVEEFFNRTLPKEEWTHEAHLIMAFYMISTYGLDIALCRIRAGIILYNDAVGGKSDENGGYHETMTCFWCSIINDYIKENQIKTGFDIKLLHEFLISEKSSMGYVQQFFSAEELKSVKLRAWNLELKHQ